MTSGGKILVMAGAQEAHALTARLRRLGRDVIASLPEQERGQQAFHVPTRVGRFAHPVAFERWLAQESVGCIIDVSHAFDDDVSRMAAAAGVALDLRYVRVLRPPWCATPQDIWAHYSSLRRAADDVAPGGRVFSNTGRATLNSFENFRGEAVFLRQIQLPAAPPPYPFVTYVEGQPPFSQRDEETVFGELRISKLICRNVGGEASFSKLLAARRLGLPVAMIDRPEPLVGVPVVETVNEALAWEAKA